MALEWTRRKLGDFTRRIKRINEAGEELPPLSVTKDRGVMLQSDKFKKRIATDLRKYLVVQRGEFAFDPMSLYYGAVGRVEVVDRGVISPDYVAFEPDDSVDNAFLDYLLRSPQMHDKYEVVAEGGNQFGKRRRVYWSVFTDIEVTLPSLSEQRKIAAILASVDDTIDKTQSVIDQLEVVKKGLLGEILTRGMPGRHISFAETVLGRLPTKWSVMSLESVVQDRSGLCYGVVQPGDHRADGVPLIRVTDIIEDSSVKLDGLKRIAPEVDAQYSRSRLQGGELLVSLVGTIGRCAIAPKEARGMNIARAVAKVPLGPSVDPHFACVFLNSPIAQRQLQGEARESARKTLNIEQLRQILIPLPSLQEQHEIASIFTELELTLRENRSTLSGLRTLKASLLDTLLSGRVRVSVPSKEAA